MSPGCECSGWMGRSTWKDKGDKRSQVCWTRRGARVSPLDRSEHMEGGGKQWFSVRASPTHAAALGSQLCQFPVACRLHITPPVRPHFLHLPDRSDDNARLKGLKWKMNERNVGKT